MARIPRQIIVTEPDGTEHTYPSVTAAATYIGVPPSRVSNACTLDMLLHQKRCRYADEEGGDHEN